MLEEEGGKKEIRVVTKRFRDELATVAAKWWQWRNEEMKTQNSGI
eukprot:COSAG05_NODE_42_length_26187_cov_393.972286_23_plen_45_part_00